MRQVSAGSGEPIRLTAERRSKLKDWLLQEHRKALDARAGWERDCQEALRIYRGDPPDKVWKPFDGAPYTEITIAAQAADAVAAQAQDLIFQVRPIVTVRSRKAEFDAHADAAQDWLDRGVQSGEFNFSPAIKESILDDVQLGTMVLYVPWMRTIRKTDIRETLIAGPRVFCLDPNDFILPAHATKDVQNAKFCTMRVYMSAKDLNLRAEMENWNIDDSNAPPSDSNPIRSERLKGAGISPSGPSSDGKPPPAMGDTFAYYDIDGDGKEEDIEVIWNMTTGGIAKVMYNRWDCRPFILECYQDRAHVPYGLGVPMAMAGYQKALTCLVNNDVWNRMIANTKMYQGPAASLGESTEIYPGKFWENDNGEIKPLEMGQSSNAQMATAMWVMQMAERRVGAQDLSAPSRLGGRTPGITALSALQQTNRRFFPAFDNMRNAYGQAGMQCLYRLQEQIRKDRLGTGDVIVDLEKKLGAEKAQLLIELLRRDDMSLVEAFDIELTASSVSVNREADRQNMIMLSQLYERYMNGMAQIAMQRQNPQFAKIADEAGKTLNRIMTKILRSFDQVSDVRSFLIDLEEVQPMMNQLGAGAIPAEMAGLLQGGGGAMPPNGTPPVQ